MNETIYELEVRPHIPKELSGLIELSNNLHYSWDRNARGLFYRLDHQLWEQCDHSPKVFLRRVSQRILEAAIQDNVFMEEYSRVMSSFNSYLAKILHHEIDDYLDTDNDLIAYFCSDLGVPFVAVGLLYRQGYFIQEIDACGNQIASYTTTRFSELPIEPAVDPDGNKIIIIALLKY